MEEEEEEDQGKEKKKGKKKTKKEIEREKREKRKKRENLFKYIDNFEKEVDRNYDKIEEIILNAIDVVKDKLNDNEGSYEEGDELKEIKWFIKVESYVFFK